jgi:hypothetical protein
MGNIISQQCSFYQLKLEETVFNMYGEAANEKYYNGPYLFFCLIEHPDQTQPTDEFGVNWEWRPTFRLLRDDLVAANVVPQIGDIILYQEGYYEIDGTNVNQFFVGKDPDYPNSINPLNPGLDQFGWDVSIICTTHYIPADKVGITKERT